ncbi:hypothetical protein MUB24_22195 [Lederbergia sp. NSJ-179]|uniref:hypothetical protein n=1 Tax=Lederbergia sp. NSJ-179 TaxID=2931402 RepID=UPI001FD4858D|nr:hypothetical protein [Lederbergia sp. NSJ-179]MCJ7843534.1 hypothetical protein [Lederbergia sp. NSJ-179]
MDDEEFTSNIKLEGEVLSEDTRFYKVIEYFEEELGDNMTSKEISTSSTPPNENVETSKSIELDEAIYWAEVEASQDQEDLQTFEYIPGTHKTSYKTLTTTITYLSSGKYRVKTSIKWHKIPSNRKIDVIGTSINSSFWAPDPGTQYGKQNWTIHHFCSPDTKHSATYSSNSNKWNKGASGCTLKINLPDNYT